MDKHWCMCTKLDGVYRDGFSTCYICGGKDAYGKSKDRPAQFRKIMKNVNPPNKKEILLDLIHEWNAPDYKLYTYEDIADFILTYQEEIENIYAGVE